MTSPDDHSPPPVLKARGPEDLLATVPYRLGFHPADSLVAVGLDGPRRRFGFTARVDLPPLGQIPAAARYLVQMLGQQGADRVLLVAYAEDDAVAGPLVHTLLQWLERSGVPVVDAYRSDGRRWYCYTCDEPCCPPSGTPYDLSDHPLVAEHVLQGQVALPDRESLRARVAAVDGHRQAEMEERFAVVESALAQTLDGVDFDRPAFLRAEMEHVRGFVAEWLRQPRPLTDAEAARLAVQVASLPVRDTAWSMMTRKQAPAHLELWQQVLTRVLPPYEPAVACLTAFSAWLSGNGALAWCAVDRALDADPDYSFTDLIVQSLERAVPPSSWEPVPQEVIERYAC